MILLSNDMKRKLAETMNEYGINLPEGADIVTYFYRDYPSRVLIRVRYPSQKSANEAAKQYSEFVERKHGHKVDYLLDKDFSVKKSTLKV